MRAEEEADKEIKDSESVLLEALLGKEALTREKAMQIPTVSACIDIISSTVASLPIKLYQQDNGETKEITNDKRVRLLTKETGDTLTAKQFWRAIIADYYMGDGGYAYIEKQGTKIKAIRYVSCENVEVVKNEDPIYKGYNIYVYGKKYYPFEFLKFLRSTKDGCTSKSILEENELILSVAYQSLVFEENIVKKGGNKKGFLKSESKLSDEVMDKLKAGFRKLYRNNEENVVVLNNGIDFKESSNTSVEMQLNENKKANGNEITGIFKMAAGIVNGKATKEDVNNFAHHCIIPLLSDLQCSIDRDMLMEREKNDHYFAFDTKELTKGTIEERYKAYETALQNNFMQVDEVRDREDLEPLGIEWIKIGLDSVLFNPKTKEIYTPNTNETKKIDTKIINKEIEKKEENIKGGEKENEDRVKE